MRGRPRKSLATQTSSKDFLDRLVLDPGTRTIGQLLQERQWAVAEIDRLRRQLAGGRPIPATPIPASPPEPAPPVRLEFPAEALLRMSDVRKMCGLSPSTVYQMMRDGRFPKPLQLGLRSVRWRMRDIEAWQAGLVQQKGRFEY